MCVRVLVGVCVCVDVCVRVCVGVRVHVFGCVGVYTCASKKHKLTQMLCAGNGC